jgi:hypothetical protein
MAAMERRIDAQFSNVQTRFDGLSFVSRDVYERDRTEDRRRITELEDAKQWMGRTLVAAFLFPTLVAIVVALVVTR